MARAISTYFYQHSRLGVPLLDHIRRAGFGAVEIYCTPHHFDYTNSSHVREVAGWFSDNAVRLHSLHAPTYRGKAGESPHSVISLAFLDKQRRQEAMDEIKRVLDVAERVPFQFLVAHLGIPGEEFDLRKFDAALTSLEHLRLFASQRGVEVIIENILNDLSTPQRLAQFVEHTHMRSLRFCFDSGHAHLDGGVEGALQLLEGRIASTHLHDNGGARDEHLLPGEGQVSWDKLIPALRRQGSAVCLVLEVRGSESNPLNLEKAAMAADRLAALLEESAA
ncbi:MAG TPA: sugar phosphate isomerase/epimerase family protein [Terriglobia bacterium]|nr:sugar phosphate isomerase/epimerase family protein [Terriglobia bacterium]